MSGVKVNGQWRNTGPAYVKINNDWRTVSESFVKVAGIWQRSTLGSPPAKPTIVYHAFGQFRITNYDPTLDYQARFAGLPGMSGGDALLNNSTGIYSLNGVNSGFYVSAAYAAGAPRSEEGYMERKARTTKREQVGEECRGTGCVPNRVATCITNGIPLPGGGGICPRTCVCWDSEQQRCICWNYGEPNPICFGPPECEPIFGDVDDKKWANSPYFYTDRGSEWSKQS